MAAISNEKILTFEEAAEVVKNLKNKPDQDTLLQIYGLYKQATVGDVNIAQPWKVQVEARAKWDAWNSYKGKTKEEAKAVYVQLVTKLQKADS